MRQRQERPAEALERARLAVAEAEACGEDRALARASSVLAWASIVLDLPDRDEHMHRALQLFQDEEDLTGVAHVANNLGGLAYYEGDWGEALSWYDRAEEALRRTGNVADAALTATNIGELLVNQQRLDDAASVLADAARVLRVVGHQWGAPFADMQRGRVALARGEVGEARALLGQCVAEYQRMGSDTWAYEAGLHLAAAQVGASDPDGALATIAEVAAEAPEEVEILASTRALVEGRALAALDRVDEATACIAAGLEAARRRGLEFDLARLLLLADELGVSEQLSLGTDTPAEDAHAILRRLGVDQKNLGSPAPS